jgi:hypothetical protein
LPHQNWKAAAAENLTDPCFFYDLLQKNRMGLKKVKRPQNGDA